MKEFYKYQHIANKFDTKEVKGLLKGNILIQPKLDGSNCQMWLQDDEIVISSRNNILGLNKDNANCYNTLSRIDKYKEFFDKYPNIKLCGEWLVRHKIQYNEDAYKKFYVFDGVLLDTENSEGQCDYVQYGILTIMLNEFNIEHVPYLCMDAISLIEFQNDFFNDNIKFVNYLIDDLESPRCEGIVVKNYNYKNSFGRSVWCKFINSDFYKITGNKTKERTIINKDLEQAFIDNNLDEHLLSKCYYKIFDFDNKKIGEYIKLCQSEFQEDFIKNYNEPLNIKVINNLVAGQAKKYLISIGVL